MTNHALANPFLDQLSYCLLNHQGQIIDCSRKTAGLFGSSPEDLQGHSIVDVLRITSEIPATFEGMLSQANATGELRFEAEYSPAEGSACHFEATLTPCRIAEGQDEGALLQIWDVTHHKQLERKLRERKELFSSTFYQAAVGMVHVNMSDARFLGANNTICEMLGYTEEEFCSKTIMDVTHPDDILSDLDNTKRMIDGEINMFSIEKRLLRKDGSSVWTRLTAASVSRDEQGHAKYGMAVVEDITQIKEAQDALKESEERFKTLADSAPVLIFMTDTNANHLYVNKNYLNYTGLTYSDLLGTQWQNRIHPEDREEYLSRMASACQHQESLRAEVRINRNDGQYGWVLVSVVPRYTATGLFMGFVGSGIDITDKKLLEESLEKAKVTAEDLNRRKSEFLSMMSHELRTPLNSIIGYSSIIQNNMAGPLNDNQSKFIQNVVYSGKHLLNLVNDLLDLSKVEAGKMKITVSQFDLPVLVQDVQSMLNDLAHRKNITLTFSIQPGITTVQADPERFKQILINLITNGIKFNRPGGEVRVRLFKRDDDAWLIGQVQDSGIGIPKSKFANLFGKFYQVDTSPARSNEGSGLGLALTKELIELHGGTIEVDSEEGVGTTFTFRLPTVQTVVVKGTHNDAVRNSSR